MLITNTEKKSHTKKLSHKSVEEGRLDKGVGICLEHLATSFKVVHQEHFRVEPRQASYKGYLGPATHPLEEEVIWAWGTKETECLAD